MRVILTQYLTDDARTLLVRLGRYVVDAHHTIKDTAMNGFETITNIRKCTSYNDGHRIVDVRGLHLFLNVDFYNSVVVKSLIHYFLLFCV